jgi:isopentenyldiphosphate isomerase
MSKNTIDHAKCVDILIFNDKGELALQMRALNDYSFPGHWDFSAGGHVDPNEESQKAAEREVFEELGVSGQIDFISREHFRYPSWDPSVTRDIDASMYKMSHNGPFNIDPKEVEKAVFFSLPVVQKMIDAGEQFHPEFLLAWDYGIISNCLS